MVEEDKMKSLLLSNKGLNQVTLDSYNLEVSSI